MVGALRLLAGVLLTAASAFARPSEVPSHNVEGRQSTDRLVFCHFMVRSHVYFHHVIHQYLTSHIDWYCR
jgi:hypothetical protein